METTNKNDAGKLRYDVVPASFERALALVLAFGAKKYGKNTWQQVENGSERYYSALRRHLAAWTEGEFTDKESGLPHLYHVAVNALFCDWFDQQKVKATEDTYDGSAGPEEVSTDCTTCPHKDECPNSEEKVVDFDALRESLKEGKEAKSKGVISVKVNVGNEEAARKVAKVIEETLSGLDQKEEPAKEQKTQKEILFEQMIEKEKEKRATEKAIKEGLKKDFDEDEIGEFGRTLFHLWNRRLCL